jgi:hypothetical protein
VQPARKIKRNRAGNHCLYIGTPLLSSLIEGRDHLNENLIIIIRFFGPDMTSGRNPISLEGIFGCIYNQNGPYPQ